MGNVANICTHLYILNYNSPTVTAMVMRYVGTCGGCRQRFATTLVWYVDIPESETNEGAGIDDYD